MTRLLPILLVLACAAGAPAETVDWSLGRSIDCALAPALPTRALTRTVVFPGGPITEVPSFWSEEQLFVKIIRNTLVFQLRDPLFTGTIQVFDDKGNLFLLGVRAARAGETVDDVLLIRPVEAAGGAAAPMPGDSDGAVTELMAHMVGGGPNPAISGSLVTHVDEHGKVVPGRRIFADDTLTLELIKVFQGPGLRGYECVVRYAGERTVRLDQQRLWFPGALAVYASNQVFINPQTVSIEIQPNQAIRIFYVAE
jgi:hypothetical protein